MTIKEMLSKVETYNEVSGFLYGEKATLCFDDGTPGYNEEVADYRTFAKYIRKNYISEVAEKILSYKGYEFEKPYEYEVEYFDGFKQHCSATFLICN